MKVGVYENLYDYLCLQSQYFISIDNVYYDFH